MKVEGITRKELTECVKHFEKFANTYFWKPPCDARSRRYEEKRNSKSWSFTVDGKPVTASVEISCSCKNYYAYRTVKAGDENKKMMIPYLKKCLASME